MSDVQVERRRNEPKNIWSSDRQRHLSIFHPQLIFDLLHRDPPGFLDDEEEIAPKDNESGEEEVALESGGDNEREEGVENDTESEEEVENETESGFKLQESCAPGYDISASCGLSFENPMYRPCLERGASIYMEITAGETFALVVNQESEDVKVVSTLLALAARVNDCDGGYILLTFPTGRIPIGKCDVQWLRAQVGLVQQQPVLVKGTVEHNIMYSAKTIADNLRVRLALMRKDSGNSGDCSQLQDELQRELERFDDMCTRERVETVSKMVDGHAMIEELDHGYNTELTEGRESQDLLQRIALARVLLTEPKILLLDKAMSALDAEAEKVLMDRIKTSRTCIVVSDRESTARDATGLFFISGARVVESGSYADLVNRKGVFSRLKDRCFKD